jgi:hypothetical protein
MFFLQSGPMKIPALLAVGFFYCGLLLGRASGEATSPGPSPFPWTNGEALTYIVSWGSFDAAEGTFVARDKGDHWDFNLKLSSRGLVSDFYPFNDYFWCVLDPTPWRSTEYGEYRFEPKRATKERTRIDYAQHQGTREIWSTPLTKTFPVTEDSLDDIGTVLYHLRTGPWKPGDIRLFHVYESGAEKEATAECEAVETRTFGAWPSQPLLRILVLPGKGTHHRGSLRVWMTNDVHRLPLHADAILRYGTFSIDLVKAGSRPRACWTTLAQYHNT